MVSIVSLNVSKTELPAKKGFTILHCRLWNIVQGSNLNWNWFIQCNKLCFCHYLVVQFYLWFKLYFPLCWGTVMFDNEFDTIPCRIRHYVESMQMLCHRVCKTYANVSYIAFTRSYVVSMPGLCFLYKKCYVFASQTEPT